MNLVGYVDADFAGDVTDLKSRSGYLFMLGNNVVSWSSTKQSIVTLSMSETEYIALSVAAQEGLWLQHLLCDINIEIKNFTLYEDSKNTILYANNNDNNRRTKHIYVRYIFINDLIQNGNISIVYIKSNSQVSDILTKPLG